MHTTLTKNEQTQVQAIYNKYKNVAGDYSSTMLEGIVHSNLDSGIHTDSLSVDDAALLRKHCTVEQINCCSIDTLEMILDELGEDCTLQSSTVTSELCLVNIHYTDDTFTYLHYLLEQ